MPPAHATGSSGASGSPSHQERIQHIEDAVLLEQVQHRLRRIDGECLSLAQCQQPGQRIDIAADQDDSGDRRIARSLRVATVAASAGSAGGGRATRRPRSSRIRCR